VQQKVGKVGERRTEFSPIQGFFYGKCEDRQRIVVADHIAFLEIKNIGNGGAPALSFAHKQEVFILHDVFGVVPVDKAMP